MSDHLKKVFQSHKIDCTEAQLQLFENYRHLLLEKNKVMNLTAIEEEEEVNYKHFLDSVLPLNLPYFKKNAQFLDIGTGAGFPAIPMKILRPDLQMTLLDSLQKRIHFIEEVNQSLELGLERLVHGRAEELGRNDKYRGKYDIVIARAVSRLNTLSEYALPFVKTGGYFIAMKGPKAQEEVEESKKAFETLKGKVELVKEYSLTGQEERTVIVIKKIGDTPKKYPRAGGKPKKNPL